MHKYIFLLCFYLISFVSNAQSEPSISDEKIVGNGIYLRPFQLFFPELIVSYEFFRAKRKSYEIAIGYKLPVFKDDTVKSIGHGLFGSYNYQYMFNDHLHAVYFSIARSFYRKTDLNKYFRIELFNRFYWMNKDHLVMYGFGKGPDFSTIRTERNYVVGLKFLAGRRALLSVSSKHFMVFDLYAGLGFRIKFFKYINENKYSDFNGLTEKETVVGKAFYPTLHLNVFFGMAQKRKRPE